MGGDVLRRKAVSGRQANLYSLIMRGKNRAAPDVTCTKLSSLVFYSLKMQICE